MRLEGKVAVITGGTGFLGSHLADTLIEKNYEVICLSRGMTDASYLESIRVPVIKASITDKKSIEDNIKEGDTVFHVAAILGAAKASKEQYQKINVAGTVNVLEAAINKKAKTFVFISSFGTMGPVGTPEKPMTEETPCKPDSLYGESKYEAEQKINELAKDKITCIIVRAPIIFGPRANQNSAASKLFNNMRKKTFVIIGDTENYFPICYVKNLTGAMTHFAGIHTGGTHAYIIADGDPVIFRDLLAHISRAFGVNRRIVHIPYLLAYSIAAILELAGKLFGFTPVLSKDVVKGMAKSVYFYDMSKARNDGYKPVAPVEEAVIKTAEWINLDTPFKTH